jgi:hypothetical protein
MRERGVVYIKGIFKGVPKNGISHLLERMSRITLLGKTWKSLVLTAWTQNEV